MSTELYFIYDSHCPWSYATTAIVAEIKANFPQINLQLLNTAYYDGQSVIDVSTIESVKGLTSAEFSTSYLNALDETKDSTLCSNLMTWVQNKAPHCALELLQALQHQHFVKANNCTQRQEIENIINQFKLSPPAKCLQNERLTKDAEFVVHEITALQELIGTAAIPALMLAVGDNLILLNHNLYLEQPEQIVTAIEQELCKQ
jgi:protein-disulfide isomerase-like protein with CxxC motif